VGGHAGCTDSARASPMMSSTMAIKRCDESEMCSRKIRAVSRSSSAPSSRFSAVMAMAVTGVRISCPALATKSRRISSMRTASVMSWSTMTAVVAAGVDIGLIVARKYRPSGFTTVKGVLFSTRSARTCAAVRSSASFIVASMIVLPTARDWSRPKIAAALRLIRVTRSSESTTITPSLMLFSTACNSERSVSRSPTRARHF